MPERRRPGYATKAQIARAVEAWRALGKEPAGIELAPDGTIRLTPLPQASEGSAYDRWKAGRA